MAAKKVLVYGGRGALGSKIVEHFREKSWWILNIDFGQNPQANENIVLNLENSASLTRQAKFLDEQAEKILKNDKLDALLCVAGGWAGGNASAEDFIETCDKMLQQSVWSSLIASRLAAKFLKEGGVLQLTGAKAALGGTSSMIGYGVAKAAVHQLVLSLKSKKSGLPKESSVVCILPVTLDTLSNRQSMPDADHSSWTPLEFIANLFFNWANDKETRPANGSLIQLVTRDGKTDLIGHTVPTSPV